MTLTSISIARYRSFKEQARLELKPLTLLFGYNSSGKSALLRLLPLLRDTLRARREPLWLGSAALRKASFPDIQCQFARSTISLSLADEDTTMSYDIRHIPEQRTQLLLKAQRTTGQVVQTLDAELGEEHTYILHQEGAPDQQVQVRPEGLHLEGPGLRWPVPGEAQLRRVQWIDAVRARISRRTHYGVRPDSLLAQDGSDAAAALAFAKLDGAPLYPAVQRFYAKHLGYKLDVDPVGDDFRLRVFPRDGQASGVDIVDTGEGLAQVLPVAVAVATAMQEADGALVALEQPELHLHPRLHEELARWFCAAVQQNTNLRLVIESHSENLLLALLIEIIEGRLSPDDMNVYWVHQSTQGHSYAERVTFDDNAIPQGGWPTDVFQEDAALATRLNTARLGG